MTKPVICILMLLILHASARAVSYSVTILNPPGYTFVQAQGSAGTQQVGSADHSSSFPHAVLWNGTPESAVDLNGANEQSEAAGTSGEYQVGTKRNGPNFHAMLWHGTAASGIDLNPSGYFLSFGFGIADVGQVGRALSLSDTSHYHAIVWRGSAASFVDLNPPGYASSEAHAISGTTEVGFGNIGAGPNHALLWHDTAASYVDLNPSGFSTTSAHGVSGSIQVGSGSGSATGNVDHALLWSGTAASVIDLNPVGFSSSSALAVSGSSVVGVGYLAGAPNTPHALLWTGTPDSALDLHPFLSSISPAMTISGALGISDNGSIFGYAEDANSNTYAVLWSPIPEPASCVLIAGGFLVTSLVTGRRHRLE